MVRRSWQRSRADQSETLRVESGRARPRKGRNIVFGKTRNTTQRRDHWHKGQYLLGGCGGLYTIDGTLRAGHIGQNPFHVPGARARTHGALGQSPRHDGVRRMRGRIACTTQNRRDLCQCGRHDRTNVCRGKLWRCACRICGDPDVDGYEMVPPAIVSLPFKLAFFVIADGWTLIADSLVRGYM
ncbi:FliP family protein [Roseovarius tolerans]|uniref:FliP family protein n=1 Tax=Roseovarius tolerans TaxID=74031 RepID=A0A1H8J6I3_9RHOB|nr:FliP family protein [Roseovarius tolerans]